MRSKHGNYNAWLHEIGFTHYEILISFDPDHVPVSEFASSLLGYFEEPAVAYVQAPQVYSNESFNLIARGAAEETYAYHSIYEMASYGRGEPVLIGCHNVQRIAALQELGGFADHAAEDLLQTVRYRLAGWQGVYVPKILASGLAPEGWAEYLTQQVRWSRSVLDIKFHHLRATNGRPVWESATEWLQGFGYLQDGSMAVGFLSLLIVLLVTGVGRLTYAHIKGPQFLILLLVIVGSDFFRQRFYLRPLVEIGVHWRAGILRLAKWPFTLKSLWLVMRNRPFEYVVTPKTGSKRSSHVLFVPHGIVATMVGTAWGAGFSLGRIEELSVHLCAAVVVVFSLGLALLENQIGYARN